MISPKMHYLGLIVWIFWEVCALAQSPVVFFSDLKSISKEFWKNILIKTPKTVIQSLVLVVLVLLEGLI